MIDFHKYLERHGEPATQALIENVERYSGVRVRLGEPLEKRWRDAMGGDLAQENAKAG